MTDQELAELITYQRLLWPSQADVDPAQLILAWRPLLADIDVTVARAAVDEIASEGDRFAPPPGMIRRRACLLVDVAHGAPSPEQAWDEVLAKIAHQPHSSTTYDTCPRWRWASGPVCPPECPHRRVEFSHPAVQAAVEGLGYRNLCESTEPMADRAHFIKFYAAALERLARSAALPPSVAAVEAGRPAALPSAGPSDAAGTALPSPEVETRDDDAGIDSVRQVRAALEAVRSANALDDEA